MEFRISLTKEENEQCRKFAEGSAPTQREYRSGGTQVRDTSLIAADTRRGKVGEVIIKKFLEQGPLNVEGIKLDFDIYPRGVWDKTDIELNGKRIAVKSAKWFSRWLLLESKDINREDIYDYYILVLIDKDSGGGEIAGFAEKDEIIQPNKETLLLKKGQKIPNTNTTLDADNHARHRENLHNSEEKWKELAESLR